VTCALNHTVDSSTYSADNLAEMIKILRKNRQKEREMRLLTIGLDNAGKTTILKRIMGQDISLVYSSPSHHY
jgi:GTPase SAR1 family protein